MKSKIMQWGVWAITVACLALISEFAVAATLVVDDNLADCPDAAYNNIQDAVDAASDGDIIKVCDGTYDESVVINGKDLKLIGTGLVTVAPSNACTLHGDVIQVYNADVIIVGLIIDATNCKGGIYALGGMQDSGWGGNTDWGPASINAQSNTVYSYQKNGITVNGPEALGHFADNTVQGSGPVGVPYYAQNGIQLGFGATGEVMRNTVEGNWYTGPDWAASGILIFESDDVVVQENTIKDCSPGIALEAWCWFFPSANNNKVVKNTIEGADLGVSVAAYDLGGYSTCDASVDNNKITNNSITSENGDTGIFIGQGSYWGGAGYTPSCDNDKLIRNTISGYATAIDADGGTATKVHANISAP